MGRTKAIALVAAVLAGGCSGPDLPAGWEKAEKIELAQGECLGTSYEASEESIEATPRAGGVVVSAWARFRCDQEAEGYVKTDGERIDLLFQPKDMDPSTVAKCDCLYELTASLGAASGAHTVTVWRRWDNLNKPNDPLQIGEASVTVP
jgi:hypothetical protein